MATSHYLVAVGKDYLHTAVNNAPDEVIYNYVSVSTILNDIVQRAPASDQRFASHNLIKYVSTYNKQALVETAHYLEISHQGMRISYEKLKHKATKSDLAEIICYRLESYLAMHCNLCSEMYIPSASDNPIICRLCGSASHSCNETVTQWICDTCATVCLPKLTKFLLCQEDFPPPLLTSNTDRGVTTQQHHHKTTEEAAATTTITEPRASAATATTTEAAATETTEAAAAAAAAAATATTTTTTTTEAAATVTTTDAAATATTTETAATAAFSPPPSSSSSSSFSSTTFLSQLNNAASPLINTQLPTTPARQPNNLQHTIATQIRLQRPSPNYATRNNSDYHNLSAQSSSTSSPTLNSTQPRNTESNSPSTPLNLALSPISDTSQFGDSSSPIPHPDRNRHNGTPQTICPKLIEGKCEYGLSGRTNGRCPHEHPLVCGFYHRFGFTQRGCKRREECNRYHAPNFCPNSTYFLACYTRNCDKKHHQNCKRAPSEKNSDYHQPKNDYSSYNRSSWTRQHHQPRGRIPIYQQDRQQMRLPQHSQHHPLGEMPHHHPSNMRAHHTPKQAHLVNLLLDVLLNY